MMNISPSYMLPLKQVIKQSTRSEHSPYRWEGRSQYVSRSACVVSDWPLLKSRQSLHPSNPTACSCRPIRTCCPRWG